MKLTYFEIKESKEEKSLDISVGDKITNSNGDTAMVIAVIDEAILTDKPLNSMWSNRIYTAQQLHDYCYEVRKK